MSPTNETHVSVEADEGQSAGHDDDEVKEETATTALALFEEGQQQSEEEQEQKEDSKLGCAFIIGALTTFLCGTLGCACWLTLLLGIPVSMIAMGGYYFEECRQEPYIPIYLIVKGVFTIVQMLLQLCKRKMGSRDEPSCIKFIDGLIGLFLFCWFIAGNVWVYKIHMPDNASCNTHLYLFSFWTITLVYIFAGLGIICACFKSLCCS